MERFKTVKTMWKIIYETKTVYPVYNMISFIPKYQTGALKVCFLLYQKYQTTGALKFCAKKTKYKDPKQMLRENVQSLTLTLLTRIRIIFTTQYYVR